MDLNTLGKEIKSGSLGESNLHEIGEVDNALYKYGIESIAYDEDFNNILIESIENHFKCDNITARNIAKTALHLGAGSKERSVQLAIVIGREEKSI